MRNRSVIELMVLCFTFVVTLTIILFSLAIIIIEIDNPEADTDSLGRTLFGLVTGILGALLGLLAGKSEKSDDLAKKPGQGA